MKIEVTKYTDVSLLRDACSTTTGKPSKMTLKRMYRLKHSPIRTQIFWVKFIGVPKSVVDHFVRHHVGVEPFVQSSRPDFIGYEKKVDRDTPINYSFLCNAESLMNMSYSRLCAHAEDKTIAAAEMLWKAVDEVDPDLADNMVPKCLFIKKCYERDARCAPVLKRQAELFDWKNRRK